jgi:hypothetical protein
MLRLWFALKRELPLAVAALVCAAVLWVYVDCAVQIEKAVTVVVQLWPDDGWNASVVGGCEELRNRSATTASVILRGWSVDVRPLDGSRIRGILRVSAEGYERVDGFNREYELTSAQFTGLAETGVRIVRILPATVSVAASRKRKK